MEPLMKRLLLALLLAPTLAWGFPTNPVLETFTGADSTTPINSNWSNAEIRSPGVGCNIRSNAAAPNATNYNGCYWNPTTFNANSEAYASITNTGSTGFFGVCVRVNGASSNSSANTATGYCVETEDSTDTFSIIRIDNVIATVLGSPIASGGQVSVGDKFGISAIGTSICAWWQDDGGAWTNMGCQTDSTYTTGGNIGLYVNGSATVGAMDDFGGGNISRQRSAPWLYQ